MDLLNVMTDNHKSRFLTSDEDMLSNLPEHLLNLILERLPIENAVRTSVLSRKWRLGWTTMNALNFDCEFSEKFSRNGAFNDNGFIKIINKIVINHKGPIFKFHLCIPQEIKLDSFQEVDQWMLILSRKCVRELIIMNFNRIYQIPSSVFSCRELRKLILYKCIFKPPLKFHGFPNLESFRLTKVNFGGNSDGTVINLPQLKNLMLQSCVFVKNFNIKAANLRTLCVIDCPDAILLRLLRSKRLYWVYICMMESIKGLVQVERYNLATMLSNLPRIVSFTINGFFLKFLAVEKFPQRLPHAVKYLRQLEFHHFNFGDLDQLQGALCMLRSSPNLEVLSLTHIQMGADADLELTSNYIESPDCLDQTLFMLQTVEMKSLYGSRSELLFIKLLLDHSPHLENMIIQPSAVLDTEKRLNIAKDVMLFPRASSKAKMVYLDPVVIS